ncbi:MAG: LamG-like jellyroll fold domain-containing protein [Opitutales bacterium]
MSKITRLACACSLVSTFGNTLNAQQATPNLIIILTDDQGYADVGFNYDYLSSIGTPGLPSEIPTPQIDRIANEGVMFTNGYVSYSVCGPSRAGLLTGRYQDRFGFTTNASNDPHNPIAGLPLNERTIAEVLGNAGYNTSVIGKWHMGNHPVNHPLNRGFDHFYGFLTGGHDYTPASTDIEDLSEADKNWYTMDPRYSGYRTRILENFERVDFEDKITFNPATEDPHLTDALTNAALEFIQENSGGNNPFMLYLSYNAPHTPLQPARQYLNDAIDHIPNGPRKDYAALIQAVDKGVGQILDLLESDTDLNNNTIVFFLSDNGGSNGGQARDASFNTPLRGHKNDMYEGGIRVPFAVRWPGVINGNPHTPDTPRTFDQPVIALDIMASIVEEAQVTKPLALDGQNILNYLKTTAPTDPSPLSTRQLFWKRTYGNGEAVREGNYKYVRNNGGSQSELFNVADSSDLTETDDLRDTETAIYDELVQSYDTQINQYKDTAFPTLFDDEWWKRSEYAKYWFEYQDTDPGTLWTWDMSPEDLSRGDQRLFLLGNASLAETAGRFGSGVTFDGSGDRVRILNVGIPGALGNTPTVTSFTVEASVQFENVDGGNNQIIFDKLDEASNTGYRITRLGTGHWEIKIGNGNTIRTVISQRQDSAQAHTWHHVALTWDHDPDPDTDNNPGILGLWLDGHSLQIQSYQDETFADNTLPLFLGNNSDGSNVAPFHGAMDQLRISNVSHSYEPAPLRSPDWKNTAIYLDDAVVNVPYRREFPLSDLYLYAAGRDLTNLTFNRISPPNIELSGGAVAPTWLQVGSNDTHFWFEGTPTAATADEPDEFRIEIRYPGDPLPDRAYVRVSVNTTSAPLAWTQPLSDIIVTRGDSINRVYSKSDYINRTSVEGVTIRLAEGSPNWLSIQSSPTEFRLYGTPSAAYNGSPISLVATFDETTATGSTNIIINEEPIPTDLNWLQTPDDIVMHVNDTLQVAYLKSDYFDAPAESVYVEILYGASPSWLKLTQDATHFYLSGYPSSGTGPTNIRLRANAYEIQRVRNFSITVNGDNRSPRTFYVEQGVGDLGTGASPSSPFDELDDIEDLTLVPGDQVRFARGSQWLGMMEIRDQDGSEGNEIYFSDYGDPLLPKPHFNGHGRMAAIILSNSDHIVIENLTISNFAYDTEFGRVYTPEDVADGLSHEPNALGQGDSFEIEQNARADRNIWDSPRHRLGILLEAWGELVTNVTLQNNTVNHIYGVMDKEGDSDGIDPIGGGSGIMVRSWGLDANSKGSFDGLYVWDNHIHDCIRNGIWGQYNYGRNSPASRVDHNYNVNVEFKRNLIERVPGDGLVVWGCEGAIVEHNIFRNFKPLTYHAANAAIGLWTIMSKDGEFRHNQVTDHQAEQDGQAFDVDFDTDGNLFEYNYSADNIGGVALLVGAQQNQDPSQNALNLVDPRARNNTFRYNLSINDGFRLDSGNSSFRNWGYAFEISGTAVDSWIHNNTFYIQDKPDGVGTEFVKFHTFQLAGNPIGFSDGTHFLNNVFFGSETMGNETFASDVPSGHGSPIFDANIYYDITKPDIELGSLESQFTTAGDNDYDLLLNKPLEQGSLSPAATIANGKTPSSVDFFGNTVLTNGLGIYSGEDSEYISMPQRLVEKFATIDILSSLSDVTVDVLDARKKPIFSEPISEVTLLGGDHLTYDLRGLSDGIYYLEVSSNSLPVTPYEIKFVKVDPLANELHTWHMNPGEEDPSDIPGITVAKRLQLRDGARFSPDAAKSFPSGLDLSLPESDTAVVAEGIDIPGTDSSFSVDAWVNFTTLNTGQRQFIFDKIANNRGYTISRQNNGIWYIDVGFGSTTTLITASAPPLEAGSWHHIALTWDAVSDNLAFWVDGNIFESWNIANEQFSDNTAADLYLGMRRNGSFNFQGFMDEVRISSEPLDHSLRWINTDLIQLAGIVPEVSFSSQAFKKQDHILLNNADGIVDVSIVEDIWLDIQQTDTEFTFFGTPGASLLSSPTVFTLRATDSSGTVADYIMTIDNDSNPERFWEEYTEDEYTLGIWNMYATDFGNGDGQISTEGNAAYVSNGGYPFAGTNNGGLSITNAGDHASIPGVHLDQGSSFTIEAWVKFNTLTTSGGKQHIFDKRWGWQGYRLIRNNDMSWEMSLGSGPTQDGSPNSYEVIETAPIEEIIEDTWHHIAMTWDSGTYSLTLWVDGVPRAESILPGYVFTDRTAEPLRLGTDRPNNDNAQFFGSIDALRLSSIARSFVPRTDDTNILWEWEMVSSEAGTGPGQIQLDGPSFTDYQGATVLDINGALDRAFIEDVVIDENTLGTPDMSFTIEATVWFDSLSGNSFILDKRSSWTGFSLEQRHDSRFRVRIGSGNNVDRYFTFFTDEVPLNVNQWHTIQLSWDALSQAATVTVDDSWTHTETFTDGLFIFVDNGSALYLGNNVSMTFDALDGKFDRVSISGGTSTSFGEGGNTYYSAWSGLYGITSGRDGNDDGDTWTNQAEYYFGSDPLNYSDPNILSVTGVGENPAVTYTYRTDANGTITYRLFRSSDLEHWYTAHTNDGLIQSNSGVTPASAPIDNQDGTATLTLLEDIPVGGEPHQFWVVEADENGIHDHNPPEGYSFEWIDNFSVFNGENWSKGLTNDVENVSNIIWNRQTGGENLLNNSYAGYITDEDVFVENGILYLQNQKRTYQGQNPPGVYEYTSGWINSKGKLLVNGTERGVYMEMRAKFPTGGNVWPAVWMVAEANVWPPEIDIWEYFGLHFSTQWGQNGGYDKMYMRYIYGPNFQNTTGVNYRIDDFSQIYNQPNEWNVYGFLWDDEKMEFTINGVVVHTKHRGEVSFPLPENDQIVPDEWWPNQDMAFVLNNGVMANGADGDNPEEEYWRAVETADSYWPNYLEIDYMVIYLEDQ